MSILRLFEPLLIPLAISVKRFKGPHNDRVLAKKRFQKRFTVTSCGPKFSTMNGAYQGAFDRLVDRSLE